MGTGPAQPSRTPDYGAGDALRACVDVVCFLVELAMLALLAFSGWSLGDGGLLGISLAVLYPALAIVVWAIYLARAAERRLRNPWRLALELVVFGGTTVAAIAADKLILGIVFAIVSVWAFGLSALIGESSFGSGRQAGSTSPSS